MNLGLSRGTITNGRYDADDPAVIGLLSSRKVLCTAVLVSPRVAITAAHCIERQQVDAVFFGSLTTGAGQVVGLADARVHPAFDSANLTNDLAVVLLSDVASTPPLPIIPEGLTDRFLNGQVRIVGFGRTSAFEPVAGQKLTGTSFIQSIADDTFVLAPGPSLPCDGDSGGPSFVSLDGLEYLVGVTSWGDGDCIEQATIARVDGSHHAFVDAYIAATKEGAAAVGERCYYPTQCATSVCLEPPDSPAFRYCTGPCASDGECPPSMKCFGVEGQPAMQCRYAEPSPGSFGAPCRAHADCATGMCGRPNEREASVCTRLCFQDIKDTCPAGLVCRANIDVDSPAAGCFVDHAAPADAGQPPTPVDSGPTSSSGCSIERRVLKSKHATLWFLAMLLARRVRRAKRQLRDDAG